MKNHKRHKFIRQSVIIEEMKIYYPHTISLQPRRVTKYGCAFNACYAEQVFYREVNEPELLFDIYYSDI